jgi:hypothetical protein
MTHLTNELQYIEITPNIKMCSLDINITYTNIPTTSIIPIIQLMMDSNKIGTNINQHIIRLTNIIIKQNYFQFNKTYYKQNESLEIGAPILGVLAEIHVQYIEHKHIYYILWKYNIKNYNRYVGNILISLISLQ